MWRKLFTPLLSPPTLLSRVYSELFYTQLNVKTVLYITIQFSVSTVSMSKTFLFQAIQFSQTVLIQAIQFIISMQIVLFNP